MAGVASTFVVGVEIDHLAAERRAVERAGEQAQHQCEARAFVTADRHQKPLARSCAESVTGLPSLALTIQPSGIGLPWSL